MPYAINTKSSFFSFRSDYGLKTHEKKRISYFLTISENSNLDTKTRIQPGPIGLCRKRENEIYTVHVDKDSEKS